jgi:cytochrome c oxidase assembly protein subunit 15
MTTLAARGSGGNLAGGAADSRATQTRQRFARLGLAAFVLTFIVVVASAFMRHTQAGLGCADWPACYAQIADGAQGPATTVGIHVARLLHRLAASAALFAIIALLWLARGVPGFGRERALTGATLFVALGLAALGLLTPGAMLPAVPLGNLGGGFLMLALLAALTGLAASAPSATGAGASQFERGLTGTLLAAAFAQALLGALIGTQFALTACPALDTCAATGPTFAIDVLNPFQAPAVFAGHALAPVGAAGLHWLHRALGGAIAVGTLALAFVSRSRDPRLAHLLACLALAAPALGATAVLHMPALAVTVLHNAVAAALVAALAYRLARRRTFA